MDGNSTGWLTGWPPGCPPVAVAGVSPAAAAWLPPCFAVSTGVTITADSSEATIAVDDLIDSGRTARMVKEKYNLNLEPLLVKDNSDWIVFPWEGTELAEDAENTVTRMLQQIGEDPQPAGTGGYPTAGCPVLG